MGIYIAGYFRTSGDTCISNTLRSLQLITLCVNYTFVWLLSIVWDLEIFITTNTSLGDTSG
jgi:hypothetical protein